MKLNNFFKLVIAVGISELAGIIGSTALITGGSSNAWYAGLAKPALNPPAWIFGPAWTTLYALMGIAAWLVWKRWDQGDPSTRLRVKTALTIFGLQLFLNAIWSVIFFGLQSPGWAFVDITLLWLAIVGTIIVFYKISRPAAFLLLPYILWVSFAGYLNYSIWTLNQETPVVCAMDAKLCPDGSYAGRVPPKCDFAPCPKEDLIRVESPMANEMIFSPLIIKGKARGSWFFEASFPIKLFDGNEKLLATTVARAGSDWMTEDFVPFEAELKFVPPETEKGIIVLEKDNPSGLLENADELRIPIVFEQEMRKIKLYYYNPNIDKDESGNTRCSRDGLTAVEREIPITKTPIKDTIKLLLLGGLTEEERARGIDTEYPLEGLSLKGVSLKDSVLTLEFDDSKNRTVGGSCRVGILWFQIEATAKQFPEVQQVRFLPEEIFQP